MLGLQPDPECGGGAEEFREPQCRLGGQAAPALRNLGKTRSWNAGRAGDLRKAQPHRLDEFLE
jgi:hypothetical protein